MRKIFILIILGIIFFLGENVFAGVEPVFIDNIPRNEDILETGEFTINIRYSDNAGGKGIIKENVKFELFKWSGNSWGNDISSLFLTGSKIDNYKAEYTFLGLNYGKYKYLIEISDEDNNKNVLESIFYVDSAKVKIDPLESLNEFIIEASTIGTPYTLTFQKNSDIRHDSHSAIIQDWNGNEGFWYSHSSNTGALLNLTNDSILISQVRKDNIDGNLNTNFHKITFGAHTSKEQLAGHYNFDLSINWEFDYKNISKGNLVNGECGLSNNSSFYSKPEIQLCSFGVPSSVVLNENEWKWTCEGLYGGIKSSCEATKINDSCDISTKPLDNGNIIFVDSGATSPNQPYQKGAIGCGYTCKNGYEGEYCQYKLVESQFCSGGEKDIFLKIDNIQYTIAGCNANGIGYGEGIIGVAGTRGIPTTEYVETGLEDGTGGKYKITGKAGTKHYYYDWANGSDWCQSRGGRLPSREEYSKIIDMLMWTGLDMSYNPPRAIQTQTPFNLYGIGLGGIGWSNNYGELGYYWTSTSQSDTKAYFFGMGNGYINLESTERKSEIALGIRCIKDETMEVVEPTYLCNESTKPLDNGNIIFVDSGASSPNQPYQKGAAGCGYTCKNGYEGEYCQYKLIESGFCEGGEKDIFLKMGDIQYTIAGCNAFGTGYTEGIAGNNLTRGMPTTEYTETGLEDGTGGKHKITGIAGTKHYYYDWANGSDWCQSKGRRLPTRAEYAKLKSDFKWTGLDISYNPPKAPQTQSPFFLYGAGLAGRGWSNNYGELGYYWTSTSQSDAKAYYLGMGKTYINSDGSGDKLDSAYSVRCIKDETMEDIESTYICNELTRPDDNGNIIYIDSGATGPNQSYQKGAAGCGYTCKNGYEGEYCNYKLTSTQFCPGGEKDIIIDVLAGTLKIAGCNAFGTGYSGSTKGSMGTSGVPIYAPFQEVSGNAPVTGINGKEHYHYDWANGSDWCQSKGRRLPTKDEFTQMINVLKWKPLTDSGILPYSSIHTQSPFYVYPSGLRYNTGTSGSMGTQGFYWSSTSEDSINAYRLGFGTTYMNSNGSTKKTYNGLSVRCVK